MSLQPISYRGRLVASVTAIRAFLIDELERRPPGDPELRFVLFMCCYARDVLTGELDGPYHEDDARRYAQAALIPDEILERDTLDVRHAADGLGVPVDELRAARAGYRAVRSSSL